MDLHYLIKSINDTDNEDIKEELLMDFISTVRSTQSVTIGNLNKLFQFLRAGLAFENKRLLSLTNMLLLDLVEFTGPDLELHFPMIIVEIVNNLGDPENEVRKLSLEVIKAFIRKTRNIEMVLDAIVKTGVESAHFFIRERAISVACELFDCEKGIFSSVSGVNDARRYLEAIIVSLFDKYKSVEEEARKVIVKISDRKYDNFFNAFKRLSEEHQKCFKQVVEDHANKLRSEKFFEINLEEMMQAAFPEDQSGSENEENENEEEILILQVDWEKIQNEFYANNIPEKREEILQFFPKQNKLYFGIISEGTLLDALNTKDVRVQTYAMQEIFENFMNMQSVKPINAFLSSFLKFLCQILKSSFVTVNLHCMNIISQLLNIPGVHQKVYLPLLIPVLVEKFSDDRVVLRKNAVQLMRKLMRSIHPGTMIKNILFFLNSAKNGSWHKREELLILLCVLLLDNSEPLLIPLEDLLLQIAYYLDDPVRKVKNASLEALSLIVKLTDKVKALEILHELLERRVYDVITDKVEKNIVFAVNKEGLLELPNYDKKQVEREKKEFIEEEKRYEKLMEQFKEEKKMFEDGTLQFEQSLIEQQQEELEKQKELDEMERERQKQLEFEKFINEHQSKIWGHDSFENELVAIDDIKMTDPRLTVLEKRIQEHDEQVFQERLQKEEEEKEQREAEAQMKFESEVYKMSFIGEDPGIRSSGKKPVRQSIPEEIESVNSLIRIDGGAKAINERMSSEGREDEKKENASSEDALRTPQSSDLSKDEKRSDISKDEKSGKKFDPRENMAKKLRNGPLNYQDTSPRVLEAINKKLEEQADLIEVPVQKYQEYKYQKNMDSDVAGDSGLKGATKAAPHTHLPQRILKLPPKPENNYQLESMSETVKSEFFKTGEHMRDRADDANKLAPEKRNLPIHKALVTEKAGSQLEGLGGKSAKKTNKGIEQDDYLTYADYLEPKDIINDRRILSYPLKSPLKGPRHMQREEDEEKVVPTKSEDDERRTKPPANQHKKPPFLKKRHNENLTSPVVSLTEEEQKYQDKIDSIMNEDLEAIADPLFAMHKIPLALKSDEWQDQVEALSLIRRMNKHHIESLYQMNISLPSLMQDLTDLVDSFRSSVSKAAMQTLIALIHSLKSALDSSIEIILLSGLKKFNEANVFMSEEAKTLLISLVKSCSDSKILQIILKITASNTRNIPYKNSVILILEKIVEKIGKYFLENKYYYEAMQLLGTLLSDAVFDVRKGAKRTIHKLLDAGVEPKAFEDNLKLTLPDHVFRKIKDVMNDHKFPNRGAGERSGASQQDSNYKFASDKKKRPDSHLIRKTQDEVMQGLSEKLKKQVEYSMMEKI